MGAPEAYKDFARHCAHNIGASIIGVGLGGILYHN